MEPRDPCFNSKRHPAGAEERKNTLAGSIFIILYPFFLISVLMFLLLPFPVELTS